MSMPPAHLRVGWDYERYNAAMMKALADENDWVVYQRQLRAARKSGGAVAAPDYPEEAVRRVQLRVDARAEAPTKEEEADVAAPTENPTLARLRLGVQGGPRPRLSRDEHEVVVRAAALRAKRTGAQLVRARSQLEHPLLDAPTRAALADRVAELEAQRASDEARHLHADAVLRRLDARIASLVAGAA